MISSQAGNHHGNFRYLLTFRHLVTLIPGYLWTFISSLIPFCEKWIPTLVWIDKRKEKVGGGKIAGWRGRGCCKWVIESKLKAIGKHERDRCLDGRRGASNSRGIDREEKKESVRSFTILRRVSHSSMLKLYLSGCVYVCIRLSMWERVVQNRDIRMVERDTPQTKRNGLSSHGKQRHSTRKEREKKKKDRVREKRRKRERESDHSWRSGPPYLYLFT